MSISTDKRILFLIYSPLLTKGGHSKNFLNLVKYLEPYLKKEKFLSEIVSINNSSESKRRNEKQIGNYSYLDYYKVSFKKRCFPRGSLVFQGLEFISNLFSIFILLCKTKPDIVYCYADKPLLLITKLKRLFKFKTVYDMRGDTVNEMKVQGDNQLKIVLTERSLSKALSRADLVFTVSSEYKTERAKCVVAKYNYYDGDLFRYNPECAQKKKEELELKEKFVFVYTGNAHYYQMIAETIRFFSQFYAKHEDSHLIIITEYDKDYFISKLDEYRVPISAYSIKALPQNKISELQCIADMGLLLRADLPLNHHAFPTKFAEYLACGVPVLTTPHIHSIRPMIKENRLGEVMILKDDYSNDINKIYTNYKHNDKVKAHCNEFAKNELRWQKKAKDIMQAILNVDKK